MSWLVALGQLLGLVPKVVEAVEAIKPVPVINPQDATIWHVLNHSKALYALNAQASQFWCDACQSYAKNPEVCPEMKRRRLAGTG